MNDPTVYEFTNDQCDVQDKAKLEQFRTKGAQWLSWLNHDEHAVAPAISSIVWNDVSFRVLAYAAELKECGDRSNVHFVREDGVNASEWSDKTSCRTIPGPLPLPTFAAAQLRCVGRG